MHRFGTPGAPVSARNPFKVAFLAALGVLAASLLAYSIVQVRQVVVLLVISMFLAVGLNPAVEALCRRGWRRSRSVLLVSFAVLLVLGGFFAAVVPPIVTQVPQLVQQVPQWAAELQSGNSAFARLDDTYQVVDRLEAAVDPGELGRRAFGGILGLGAAVLTAFVSTLTIFILTLYFLSNLPGIKAGAYRLAPASRRERVTLLGDEVLRRVGGYVLGTLTTASVAALATFLLLVVLGVPYPVALAAFVGVCGLIPLVGSTIGGVVVAAVAFFVSVPVGLIAVAFYLGYQQVENYVIVPRVMKRAVDVSPLTTVVAALVGGTLLGILGALLAIPTAAAIQLVAREVFVPRQDAS